MITIQSDERYEGTEHYRLTVGDEVVCIDFGPQIDDILVTTPNGDILLSWDSNGFEDDDGLLIQAVDHLKEINNLKCTQLYLKSYKPGVTVTDVFVTAQRN